MKVEKISDNKVRITLSIEELENRQVTLNDIEKNNSAAKDLFIDLLEETNLVEDFIIEDSDLYIEASSDNNNLFIFTITKIDDLPDLRKYELLEANLKSKEDSKKRRNSNNTKKNNIKYTVDSTIYSFKNIDVILDLCSKAKSEDVFYGKNSLYRYKDLYFLIFGKTTIKNPRFLKTFLFLSEYCQNYYSYDLYETAITEKAKLIIKNNAMQKLSKI